MDLHITIYLIASILQVHSRTKHNYLESYPVFSFSMCFFSFKDKWWMRFSLRSLRRFRVRENSKQFIMNLMRQSLFFRKEGWGWWIIYSNSFWAHTLEKRQWKILATSQKSMMSTWLRTFLDSNVSFKTVLSDVSNGSGSLAKVCHVQK